MLHTITTRPNYKTTIDISLTNSQTQIYSCSRFPHFSPTHLKTLDKDRTRYSHVVSTHKGNKTHITDSLVTHRKNAFNIEVIFTVAAQMQRRGDRPTDTQNTTAMKAFLARGRTTKSLRLCVCALVWDYAYDKSIRLKIFHVI